MPGEFVYILSGAPEWRNWQTRGTQNPVLGNEGVGSIPSSGTPFTLFSLRERLIINPFLSFIPEP